MQMVVQSWIVQVLRVFSSGDIIGNFTIFEGFKCTRFRKGILDYSLECITLLQNDFFKQRYITFNVTIPGQDRIDPNTYLCRTFFTGYIQGVLSAIFSQVFDKKKKRHIINALQN